ncbi:MAG: 23S rRNA (guanosine(2251)-2'-O)-methyltransferase RlmB [Ilumatobacteraceae bacterium]
MSRNAPKRGGAGRGGKGGGKKDVGRAKRSGRTGRPPKGESTGSGGKSFGGSRSGGGFAGSRSGGSRTGGGSRGTGGPRSSGGQGGGKRFAGARRGPAQGPRPKGKHERGLGGEQIEGRQAVRELLMAGTRRAFEVLIAADVEPSPLISDIEMLAGERRVQVRRVPRREIENMARSEAPQGIIARAAALEDVVLDDVLTKRSEKKLFLVAVDGVTDPGNLGAILRSCDGAGVDAVILPRHRAVHVTPTVAKSAAGAVEYVPMCVVPGLPSAMQSLKDAGVWVVGLDDEADKSLFELGDLAAEHVCVVLGAEGAGLSRLVRERCDLVVSIPMEGSLSSLNVSAAAALATYEVVRTRRTHS